MFTYPVEFPTLTPLIVFMQIYSILAEVANAHSTLFYIERNRANYEMFIDNVSMTLLADECSDIIVNGDFASGIAEHWSEYTGTMSVAQGIEGVEDYALSVYDGSGQQYLNPGCFIEGNTYKVSSVSIVYPSHVLFFSSHIKIIRMHDLF